VAIRLGRGIAPVHSGAECLHCVRVQLEHTIADPAFQILEVLVRYGQRREIIFARWIAGALGDAECPVAFELFDVLYLLDIQPARRVHPDGAEHRYLFGGIGIEQLAERGARQKRLMIGQTGVRLLGQEGRERRRHRALRAVRLRRQGYEYE
jgi:hypothetical protein